MEGAVVCVCVPVFERECKCECIRLSVSLNGCVCVCVCVCICLCVCVHSVGAQLEASRGTGSLSSSSGRAAEGEAVDDKETAAMRALHNYAGLLNAVHENNILIELFNNPTGVSGKSGSEFGRAKSVAKKLGLKLPDEE